MKLVNKIGMSVVALILAGIVSFVIYEKRFENKAYAFFDAIKQKNPELVSSFLPNNGNGPAYTALFNDLVPRGATLNFKANGMFSQNNLLFTENKFLSGTINPEGVDKPISVVVLFVKENDDWKIQEVKEDIKKGEPTAAEIEEKARIMNLVRQSMADFILSKKMKSMDHFYETISDAWKKDTTVEALNKSFAPVLADKTDWGFLNPVEPELTKWVVKDGVLTVIGVYPSRPKRLIFEQNYIKEVEDGEWKLAGFKLYTADPDDSKPTGETQQSSDIKSISDKKSDADSK